MVSYHRRATTEVNGEAIALTVDLSPVPDIDNNHHEDGIPNLVQDAIVPNANSEACRMTGELPATRWPRILGQSIDHGADSRLDATWQMTEGAQRGRAKLYSVGQRIRARGRP